MGLTKGDLTWPEIWRRAQLSPGRVLCEPAQAWIAGRRDKRLTALWRDCRKGSWMAWWLFDARGLAPVEMCEATGRSTIDWTGYGYNKAEELQLANELRRVYTAFGKRRA